jgi:hypothetical protein
LEGNARTILCTLISFNNRAARQTCHTTSFNKPFSVLNTLIYFVDAAPFSAYLGFANVSLNSIRMFQISDDAADSPQTINLGGTANPAVVVGPAAGGSTSATVAAGQTASYNVQITPGPGYTGTVALAYSGAPLAASIQAPSSLQISNGIQLCLR